MWSFPRCVSGQESSLGIWVLSKEEEKRQKGGGVVWEPGEGNLGKEGVELLQFSGSTLTLSSIRDYLRRNLERGNVVDMKETPNLRCTQA